MGASWMASLMVGLAWAVIGLAWMLMTYCVTDGSTREGVLPPLSEDDSEGDE